MLRACLLALALPLAMPAGAQPLLRELRLIAPAAPGGGWDQTARVMQQVLQRTGIVTTPVVDNIPGAAGTIGLARFVGTEQGRGDALLVSGLIMLGGIVMHQSPITTADAVPLARLTGEYEVITVPTASPFRTLDDLIAAFRAAPEAISWGGGSAGGSDQILAGLFAKAVGVAPRRVNYIAFSGGGESLAAILGGQVSVGVNGLAEFLPQMEAGTVRILAISSAQRLPGIDIPTLREQGVDVEFENWRSVLAPPGISAADRERLTAVLARMVQTSEWREMLERYRWLDRYLAGDDFTRFTAAEEQRVRGVLRELGVGDDAAQSLRDSGPYPLFVLAGLALFGVLAALGIVRERLRARATAARGHWRPIAWIAAGALANVALAERAGFVLASAALFWLVARAFDARHPWRDAAFAVGIATAAYVLFADLLDVQLPAGVLAGLL
ncbi:MAG TPA: tripartite tricarboxylate transporter substrate-binding protein [Gammaproteobacteria bacterium]|nr:tripartite tricarboxylate transporter substrate-binding protein [Gammaproteobacteria bacterium]